MIDEAAMDLPAPAKRGRPALLAALAAAVLVGGFVGVLATRTSAVDKQSQSPLIGKAAPPIAGNEIGGGKSGLGDFRGKFVVVNFFASWCVPCQKEHPELTRFVARHAAAGDAAVLGVIFDDTPSDVRASVGPAGAGWPIIDDPDGQAALDYGVRGPPESYLVDPSGRVLAKFIGGVTADGLDRVLAQATGRGAGP